MGKNANVKKPQADGRLEARDKRHILGPAIPRPVAPQQSLFPLHRTTNNITNKNISVIRDRIGVTKHHYSLHEKTEMQLKTILNSVTHYKSFVFGKIWKEGETSEQQYFVVEVKPRKNSKGICSECDKSCPTYDTALEHRWWEFVPLWAIPVYFVYRMRRVTCSEHGIVTEKVPWSDGKHTQTVEQRQFLANWARRLSWSEVAECFGTTFGKVYRAVKWIVDWGLKHRSLDGVEAIGVDEVQIKKGHHYATLVYQLDDENKRSVCSCDAEQD